MKTTPNGKKRWFGQLFPPLIITTINMINDNISFEVRIYPQTGAC